MSIEVSKFYWDQCTDIKGSDRLVIIALAEYCNESGWCFPSVHELARRCQLSDRGTQKILAKLAAGGHIAIEANQGTRKTSGSPTHRYHLLAYQRNCNCAKGEPMRSPFMNEPDAPKDEPIRSPIDAEKGEQNGIRVNKTAAKGEPASSPEPPIDPPIDPVKDNTTREASPPEQPTVSSSSSRPAGTERIRLPAAAVAALTQPHDPAYVAAKVAYENNIGLLTPMTSDLIKTALHTYPPEWIPLAIERAVAAEKRQWNYVAGILRNWSNEGFTNGAARTGNAGRAGSKSMGYGRQLQATNKKGPQTNEYENDPEYIAFLAGFDDRAADGAAIAAD